MSPRYRDAPPSYRGSGGGYGRGPSVLDLIMSRGEDEAESAYRGADAWGQTIQGLTGVAHDYFQRRDTDKANEAIRTAQQPYPEATKPQGWMPGDPESHGMDHLDSIMKNVPEDRRAEVMEKLKPAQEARQMAKRDAAWVGYVESGEWQKDPQGAYVMARKIWGPKGEEQFKALQGVAQLSQEKRNPEADQKSLGALIGAMGMVEEPARARLYPQAAAVAKRAFPELEIPEQYDPERWAEFDAIGKQLRGEKPPEPKQETRGIDVQAADALARGDMASYERLKKVKKEMGQADDRPYRDPVPVIVMTADGPQIVDRKAGTARGITDAKGAGVGLAPTADERNRNAATGRVAPVLDSIAELSEKINTQNGVIATISGAAEKKLAEVNLSNDVAEYEAVVASFTPLLARAMGHTGVLTQQDVDSARAIVPHPKDSKALRDRKMARISKLMGGQSGAAPAGGTLPVVSSPEEAAKLPPGTEFMTPDGRKKRVPLAR